MDSETIINTRKIVKTFAAAVIDKNFELIESLLAEDGNFQRQDAKLETISINCKYAFMEWFRNALSVVNITKIEYDNCILCNVGAPVVIFNDGQFPKVRLGAEKSMNGLMLEIQEGLIKGIAICYCYAVRENKTQYECMKPKVDKLMSEGLPMMEAINMVFKSEGYPGY